MRQKRKMKRKLKYKHSLLPFGADDGLRPIGEMLDELRPIGDLKPIGEIFDDLGPISDITDLGPISDITDLLHPLGKVAGDLDPLDPPDQQPPGRGLKL